MVSEVMIPVMDQTTETVTLAKWVKREGDAVKKGEAVCEIETEKATVEIDAPADGVVRRVLIEQGTQIPPKTVVALIADAEEALPKIDPFYHTPRAANAQPAATIEPNGKTVPTVVTPSTKPDKVIASPRARKLAEENGIELATVTPTGPEGRILEEDVKVAIQQKAKR